MTRKQSNSYFKKYSIGHYWPECPIRDTDDGEWLKDYVVVLVHSCEVEHPHMVAEGLVEVILSTGDSRKDTNHL